MDRYQQLHRNAEKAYQAALKAMCDLVDVLTAERDYYREMCEDKMKEKL